MISSIEEEATIRVSARAADLLAEMIGEELAPGRGRPKTLGYADMSASEQRAYKAERARERRARIKTSIVEDGVVPFDADTVRDALADAAIVILANNFQGAENVRRYLANVFRDKPGAPLTIEAKAKSGQIRPRYLKLTQPKSI